MASEPKTEEKAAEPALSIRDLTLRYARRSVFGIKRNAVTALDQVSLDIQAGKTLAIVGPSGSGKSSLARCIVLLEQPSSGEIIYRGQNLLTAGAVEIKSARREIHYIFQDSATAMNPRLTIDEIVAEPLQIHEGKVRGADREQRVREAMDEVELPVDWRKKRPLELSGGQRQRVAIARALVLKPRILILDEALGSLDASAQAQIANLLLKLQSTHSLTYAFITHDLGMAAAVADDVAVLRAGRIVLRGAGVKLFTSAHHPAAGCLSESLPSGETVIVP